MAKNDYWQRRFELLESQLTEESEQYVDETRKAYIKATQEIEEALHSWFAEFANLNKVSLADAKKMLKSKELQFFHMSVEEYIKIAQIKDMGSDWDRKLRSASIRVHVNRLEAIKIRVQAALEELKSDTGKTALTAVKNAYKDGYYRSVYEIQKGVDRGRKVDVLTDNFIGNAINKPWTADGVTFSKRIWGNVDKLNAVIASELTQGLIIGEPSEVIARRLAKKMDVAYKNAETLILSERAAASNSAQLMAFAEYGIEELEFNATLDNKTSQICRDMDKRRIRTSDAKIGETAPPMHVRCRSVLVPYIEDLNDVRIARKDNGKTYYVPSNLTYEQWHKDNSLS